SSTHGARRRALPIARGPPPRDRGGRGGPPEMSPNLSPTNQGLIATFIFMVIILVVLLTAMAYLTWAERKVLAKMQDRYGPTRTGPAGLLQPLADGIKLLAKEDVVPANADRYLFLF